MLHALMAAHPISSQEYETKQGGQMQRPFSSVFYQYLALFVGNGIPAF